MNINSFTNEIYRKIKQYRIEAEMTQSELAAQSGISLRTIQRFESGGEINLSAFLRILIALGLADNVNNAIPDMEKRPSVLLRKEQHHEKKRVRKKEPKEIDLRWGDEK
ncbi:helix-turn-helix domain-containing protein [Butyrivibrio sp. XPD2002]|uniref:helix-turn-helix domain-containing protein n=1 Tax=Butyrivibrio sp. XPD2002 TaxID=1280665 RepID=UPI0003FE181A|nr:helix-turn-helix transcriptional regulator [Butyrivibrio sp. XPD2002]MCR5344096.1 helix-turn-helix domain-containing protein [Butyrivibrio sp.]